MKYIERLGISAASVLMVSASLILVALLLCIAEQSLSSTFKGLFAAMTASFIFGSTGVPMKLPPDRVHDKSSPPKIDPFLFALWTSVGIFIVSCPLIVFIEFRFTDGFNFKPWALLGSADVILISYLTFHAVQMLGYARAPAIWASVGMTTAFTLGITVFQEALSNILLGSFAIPTLVLGVVLILSCQQIEQSTTTTTTTTTTTPSKGNVFTASEGGDEEEETVYLSTDVFPREFSGIEREKHIELETNKREKTYCDDNVSTAGKKKDSEDSNSGFIIEDNSNGAINESVMLTPNGNGENDSYYDRKNTTLLGNQFLKLIKIAEWDDIFVTAKAVGLCIIAGICDGSLMVPFKLSLAGSTADTTLHDTLCYLASFGLASLAITPVIFLLHCWVLYMRSHSHHTNIHHLGTLGETYKSAMHAAYNHTELRPDSDEMCENSLHSLPQESSSYNRQWYSSIVPGLSSGILWAAGNIMSVHATWFLGMKVGFPLTQTCVVFNALWGIFYFKEIDLFDGKSNNFIRFACGLAAIILGSFFLADSAA